MARNNHLPPISLKTIVDARIKDQTPDRGAFGVTGLREAQAVLRESRSEFTRELPILAAFYRPYQRRVSYMWFFLPALAGAIVAYRYAKSCTPALFASLRQSAARVLFRKSPYDDLWQSFIKPKKRP